MPHDSIAVLEELAESEAHYARELERLSHAVFAGVGHLDDAYARTGTAMAAVARIRRESARLSSAVGSALEVYSASAARSTREDTLLIAVGDHLDATLRASEQSYADYAEHHAALAAYLERHWKDGNEHGPVPATPRQTDADTAAVPARAFRLEGTCVLPPAPDAASRSGRTVPAIKNFSRATGTAHEAGLSAVPRDDDLAAHLGSDVPPGALSGRRRSTSFSCIMPRPAPSQPMSTQDGKSPRQTPRDRAPTLSAVLSLAILAARRPCLLETFFARLIKAAVVGSSGAIAACVALGRIRYLNRLINRRLVACEQRVNGETLRALLQKLHKLPKNTDGSADDALRVDVRLLLLVYIAGIPGKWRACDVFLTRDRIIYAFDTPGGKRLQLPQLAGGSSPRGPRRASNSLDSLLSPRFTPRRTSGERGTANAHMAPPKLRQRMLVDACAQLALDRGATSGLDVAPHLVQVVEVAHVHAYAAASRADAVALLCYLESHGVPCQDRVPLVQCEDAAQPGLMTSPTTSPLSSARSSSTSSSARSSSPSSSSARSSSPPGGSSMPSLSPQSSMRTMLTPPLSRRDSTPPRTVAELGISPRGDVALERYASATGRRRSMDSSVRMAAAHAAAAAVAHARQLTVLVVDGDADRSAAFQEQLEMLGHVTLGAATEAEALERCARYGMGDEHSVCAAFVDVILAGGVVGVRTALRIHCAVPDATVIITSDIVDFSNAAVLVAFKARYELDGASPGTVAPPIVYLRTPVALHSLQLLCDRVAHDSERARVPF